MEMWGWKDRSGRNGGSTKVASGGDWDGAAGCRVVEGGGGSGMSNSSSSSSSVSTALVTRDTVCAAGR